jgi:hypothetical protein
LREEVCRLVVELFTILKCEATSARGMAGAAWCGDEVEMDVRDDLGVSLLLGGRLFPGQETRGTHDENLV